MSAKSPKLSVFLDFDNTITAFDVLDDIIKRFSVDRNWVGLEKDWKEGRIGSRQCLSGQLKGVRVTKKDLSRYLSVIKLDRGFLPLFERLKAQGIRPVILSDSFTFFIRTILSRHGIKGVRIYSNRIRFDGDKVVPLFPYVNKGCLKCANCKTSHLPDKNAVGKTAVVYIGDGLSDVCPATHADIVFAKGSLLSNLRARKKACIKIRDLRDVDRYFKEAGNGTKGKN